MTDNHCRIAIEIIEGNLSQGLRQLNDAYTQQSNCKHGLLVHLFQVRNKTILFEKEAYLLELLRYVVLNPIRTGMVNYMEDWL